MSEEHNTLFMLTNWGLKRISKDGVFESHMWNLDSKERSMQYFSMHRSKSDRAYRGGQIVEIRHATKEDIETHQKLMEERGREHMKLIDSRMVIVFRMIPTWDVIWPQEAKTNPMAYKGTGYVDVENSA